MNPRDIQKRRAIEYAKYAAAFGALALYAWRYTCSVARPQLYFKAGRLSKIVVERCPELMKPYLPAPLAISPHLQTMLTVLRGLTIRGQYYREIRGMSDGGCIALDWYKDSHVQSHTSPTAPLVLVMHGLTGGSSEGYIKWICSCIAERGWRAVVMNYRGCAGLPLTSPQCYNAVFTDDIHEAVLHVSRKFPAAPVFAVGYSLGALLLTKYTAEADSGRFGWQLESPSDESSPAAPLSRTTSSQDFRDVRASTNLATGTLQRACKATGNDTTGNLRAPSSVAGSRSGAQAEREPWWRQHEMPHRWTGSGLAAAVMVSNPFCMSTANENLEKPWTMGWLYNLVLTHRLKDYMHKHQHQLDLVPEVSLATVTDAKTLRQFDTAATCHTAGYASAELYYSEGSSQNFIPRIRTPSLFLVSQDDPFLGRLPVKECRENENTVLAVTACGGHCAHLQGLWPLGRSWADGAVVRFFEALRPAEGLHAPHSSLQGERL